MKVWHREMCGAALAALSVVAISPALAQTAPQNLLPPVVSAPRPLPKPAKTPPAKALAQPVAQPVPAATATPEPLPQPQPSPSISPSPVVPKLGPQPMLEPVMHWSVADAAQLLRAINTIDAEGLFPADYQPDDLQTAMAAGEGQALDAQASRSFDWLVEDLRDGRTPFSARVQWFAVDPDQDVTPTAALLAEATGGHDIAGVLARLDPTHPDFVALKAALASVLPKSARADEIRVNMERWRWLPRDLGEIYLYVNVPAFEVRLMRGSRIVRTYRAIVGKRGETATPQLAEKVEAVVFNPTWTIPQSIISKEHWTAAKARARGFKAVESSNGSLTVIQPPGDKNSLGRMKIDMPNPHAIYLHDTPGKGLFNATVRDFSHGCIRTERAVELGMTMAMMGAHMTPDDAVKLASTTDYKRVPMTRTFPVYISYFTMATDDTGKLTTYADIYGRDAPVVASLHAARAPHTTQRTSGEKVVKVVDPL